jgi:hypothetical protein
MIGEFSNGSPRHVANGNEQGDIDVDWVMNTDFVTQWIGQVLFIIKLR